MQRVAAIFLHATAAGVMTWGWISFFDQPIAKFIMTQKGGLFQFLTNQGVLFAWSYMTTSMFCDILPSVPAAVLHLKKILLVLSISLGFVVSGIYWPLLLIFPKLITPPTAVSLPPLGIDLALHATPFLTLLIDFLVFEPKFSDTYVHKTAPAAMILFTVSYASFVEYCASFNATFPYPFLTQSPFEGRVLIYTAGAGMAFGIFRMLNALHG